MHFDNEFINRIIQHDELAFAQFYEQTVDDFFRYVMSHYTISEWECQDIISDVYVKIRENLDNYDSKYLFWQYVRSILKNHCKDYYKKARPILFSEISGDLEAVPIVRDWSESDDLFDFDIDHTILQDALRSLDKESQELIHSRYLLWYSYDTLADIHNMQVDAIRQKISRIVKKLRSKLAYTYDE